MHHARDRGIQVQRCARRGGRPHRHPDALQLLEQGHRHEASLRPAGEEQLRGLHPQVAQHRAAGHQHVVRRLLVAALDQVAFGLLRRAHAEVVGADDDIALPRELRQHQLCLGRLLGNRRHFLLPVHRAVLVRNHREGAADAVGNGNEAGRGDRPVRALGNHRFIGDAVQAHGVARRRVAHRQARERGRVDLQDAVQAIDVPARDELVAQVGADPYLAVRLCRSRDGEGKEKDERAEGREKLLRIVHRS